MCIPTASARTGPGSSEASASRALLRSARTEIPTVLRRAVSVDGGERDLGGLAPVVTAPDSYPDELWRCLALPSRFDRVVVSADPVSAFGVGDRSSRGGGAQLRGTVVDASAIE